MSRMIETSASDRPMRRLGDAMYGAGGPTAKQQEAIDEVYAMAAELGALPERSRSAYLAEIRQLTTGRQRWLATRHTRPDHPMFPPLMALLDALIADQGGAHTKHGTFTEGDIVDAEAKIEREPGGRSLLVFPVRYAWLRKPNANTGDPGQRGQAVYRRRDERGPEVQSFRVVRQEDVKDWWDE